MESNPTIIILTYNEEVNITECLKSVEDWAVDIFVVDSFSTDRTCEIAESYGCKVMQNDFLGYPDQRNWALDHLPVKTEWVFFLDADERATDVLKNEISILLQGELFEDGFFIKRRLIWMGKWIKRGYYPVWLLRLFRFGKGWCEDRAINEHFVVQGKTGYLKNDFIHEDKKDISHWVHKHNQYASKEAEELLKRPIYEGSFFRGSSQAEKKRWLRNRVWVNLPPLIWPFIYFFYRYVLKGGFLDGKEALIYHMLQGLWYPLLIDAKYLEIKIKKLN